MWLLAVVVPLCLSVQPCPSSYTVASFTTSSTFDETAYIEFGGELYVRANVAINSFTNNARVVDFRERSGDDVQYGFVIAQDGTSGKLVLTVDHKTEQSVVHTTAQLPLGQQFLLELTITRGSVLGVTVAVMYVDGKEQGRGDVALLPITSWKSNYIGHSHVPTDTLLDGTVSDFQLSQCTPPVPKPCDNLIPVTSFTSSKDFDETAPLTFGGELYVRATIFLSSYTDTARLYDFRAGQTPHIPYGHKILVGLADGGVGVLVNDGQSESNVVAGNPVPLRRAFLLEVTITRAIQKGVAKIFFDGVEKGGGPIGIPPIGYRDSNFIGHPHDPPKDLLLDGTVSDFQLSHCTPPVPKPCDKLIPVTSFTSFADFDETAPITFGGELYVRATVKLNSYTQNGRVIDFRTASGQCPFVLTLLGTGKLMVSTDGEGEHKVLGTRQVPLVQPFHLEVTITRSDPWNGTGVAVIYINGEEDARGPVVMPTNVIRNSNYIGRSHDLNDANLDGSVSDFELSQCALPPVPKPCGTPTPVTSFTTSKDFSETAPITFGGELYLHADVVITSYGSDAPVVHFAAEFQKYGFVISQFGMTGKLTFETTGAIPERVEGTAQVPLGQKFLLELTITRDSPFSNTGVAVMYLNGLEYAQGPAALPVKVMRNSNYIARGPNSQDLALDGIVSKFELSQCTPPVPKPCTTPTPVTSFTTSKDFSETAPITFGGELYVRVFVNLTYYTSYARVIDFTTEQQKYGFVISQLGRTGKLMFETDGTTPERVEGTAQVPLGQNFLLELTITRDSPFSDNGVAVMYVNSVEYARGPVAVPTVVMRNSNFIGHSHAPQDDLHIKLDGTVSDFELSQCVLPTVPKPCDTLTPVTSFTTSKDFSETAPITFGGELYVRAVVLLKNVQSWATVFDLGRSAGQDSFRVMVADKKLVLVVFRGLLWHSIDCSPLPAVGVAFLLEATMTRADGPPGSGLAAVFINGVECGRGALPLPHVVVRSSNAIGRSHTGAGDPLKGDVWDFLLSKCTPPVLKPCAKPTPVSNFASSSDFVGTAPVTFGGAELYVRATVTIKSHVMHATVCDFAGDLGQDSVRLVQDGTTGAPRLVVFRGLMWQAVSCTAQPPLHQPFTLEAIIARAGSSGGGVAVVYMDGVECGRGSVHLPRDVVRSSNFIGRSRTPSAPSLNGAVSDFQLSVCR